MMKSVMSQLLPLARYHHRMLERSRTMSVFADEVRDQAALISKASQYRQ
jgi:hypothetical protein